MKLDLDTLVIDCSAEGPMCVRLPNDPVGSSSIHPVIECAILDSPEVAEFCRDRIDCSDPTELNFDDC